MNESQSGFANVLIGHSDNGQSGVTVLHFAQRACAAFFMPGSAPATRDTQLLDPSATVNTIHALCFAGGSALALGVADGVQQFLLEKKIGLQTDSALIPIVPAACIYDLQKSRNTIPTVQLAYQACQNASENNFRCGQIGAGFAATVGKYYGSPDVGGFGCALLEYQGDIKLLACVVVNALGDIYDSEGKIIAGARDEQGNFLGFQTALLQKNALPALLPQTNTSLVAIITNVALDKAKLKRLAKMASAGFARAVNPAFSCYDGDVIFAVAMGNLLCDEVILGYLAAAATQQAFINAIVKKYI
jgi:L-aminopeptidase/D-esterase-like protein